MKVSGWRHGSWVRAAPAEVSGLFGSQRLHGSSGSLTPSQLQFQGLRLPLLASSGTCNDTLTYPWTLMHISGLE